MSAATDSPGATTSIVSGPYSVSPLLLNDDTSLLSQPLPPNVTPAISPESPTGEIYRYVVKVPKDSIRMRARAPQAAEDAVRSFVLLFTERLFHPLF